MARVCALTVRTRLQHDRESHNVLVEGRNSFSRSVYPSARAATKDRKPYPSGSSNGTTAFFPLPLQLTIRKERRETEETFRVFLSEIGRIEAVERSSSRFTRSDAVSIWNAIPSG